MNWLPIFVTRDGIGWPVAFIFNHPCQVLGQPIFTRMSGGPRLYHKQILVCIDQKTAKLCSHRILNSNQTTILDVIKKPWISDIFHSTGANIQLGDARGLYARVTRSSTHEPNGRQRTYTFYLSVYMYYWYSLSTWTNEVINANKLGPRKWKWTYFLLESLTVDGTFTWT
jgi:hypothetical protein